MRAAVIICILAFVGVALAEDWAVLVAGSNTYGNYRHQADICHAYQVLKKGGMPDSRIITMFFDDIANAPENPFPGKIFNKPAAAGVAGVDVYAGCKKDYTGNDVTAANFINVITGNAAAMKGIGSGKVLASTITDRVFINFSDHGGTGIIAFPVGDYLQSDTLNNALKSMHTKKMFSKLVFYLEACESGSMFQGLLPTDLNIYATSASNPDESSWGTYCPPDDKVNGKELGSCLGDLYSVNWMENSDSKGLTQTLEQQFDIVKNLTDKSQVMQWGDLAFTSEAIGDFEGQPANTTTEAVPFGHGHEHGHRRSAGDVSSRDIPLHLKYYKYIRTPKRDIAALHAAAAELQQEINSRLEADLLFMNLAKNLAGDNAEALFTASTPMPVSCGACCAVSHKAVLDHCGGYSDYSMQYARVVTNLCLHLNPEVDQTQKIVNALQALCL